MKTGFRLALTLAILTAISANLPAEEPVKREALPFTAITIDDDFWAPRMKKARERTLPHNFRLMEETGRLSNFAKAAGRMEGEYEGYYFNDSDVYKAIEAAAYALAAQPDPSLDAFVDDLIEKIAAAQQEDGYLNSFYTLTEPDQVWTNLAHKHELYCAGHLMEAGVAHRMATGKDSLLNVALRFADLIDRMFGADQRRDVPGHEEIELALVKLYRLTGEERYLELARFFVDERGQANDREIYGEYCQDHMPVRDQREIVGHAVRAMYLYSAVADLAAITGDHTYVEAMDRIWEDVVLRKMYITGGVGPSAHNEGFTTAYDLPNDSAYSETCASIGLVLWSHRLNLLHGKACYADVMERVMYNALLAGISLEGDTFFYTNPLGSKGNHHRKPWYSCACCPPNLARFFLSLGGYVYASSEDAVYVNLYVGSTAQIPVQGMTVEIKQETLYPWSGAVDFTVNPPGKANFDLCLRIPGWCTIFSATLNGRRLEPEAAQDGYLHIRREWSEGDFVELIMSLPIEWMSAHPQVEANQGRVALQRGPLVYCLEGVDNGGRVKNLVLPLNSTLKGAYDPNILGGMDVIRGTALAAYPEEWSEKLYQAVPRLEPWEFTAIPYYAWDNREAGEMTVWLPLTPELVPPAPLSGVSVKASHCYGSDTLLALCDREEPASSDDHGIPRLTFWPRMGSVEWVRYDFDAPRTISRVQVYWFDDGPKGGCRIPTSWKLFYQDQGEWREVTNPSGAGIEKDQYNALSFEAVKTGALKMEVQLGEGFSGGILEWKIN
jgi:DUF1680 family protein